MSGPAAKQLCNLGYRPLCAKVRVNCIVRCNIKHLSLLQDYRASVYPLNGPPDLIFAKIIRCREVAFTVTKWCKMHYKKIPAHENKTRKESV